MDGDSGPGALGQAGYAVTGSGGGGVGGQYVFVNLEQVDAVITDAEALLTEIRQDGDVLVQARQLIKPPARDFMSVMEAKTTVHSLEQAERHNRAMAGYVESELAKLRICRAAYANTDEDGAARLRTVRED